MVKEKSALDRSGKSLMGDVFNPSSPVIKLNSLLDQTERNEQEGFMHLFMGAMLGIRNPKSHDLVDQRDPYRTFEYLAFASLLARRIDEGIVVRDSKFEQRKTDGQKPSESQKRQRLNSDIVEEVLNPAYSELSHLLQSLKRIKENAEDVTLNTPFLNQVTSNWLYTKIEPKLGENLDSLRQLIVNFNDSKETCRSLANQITNRCAAKAFEFHGVSFVFVWYHRGIPQQPVEGRGIWFNVLLGDSPLKGSLGSRVSRIELQAPNSNPQYFDLTENRELIEGFLALALEEAMTDKRITSWRESLSEITSKASNIKNQLGEEMDRLKGT